MSLCHQSVLVGEMKSVVVAFVVSQGNGCVQCFTVVTFQMKGSIPFLQRYWEKIPAASEARLADA